MQVDVTGFITKVEYFTSVEIIMIVFEVGGKCDNKYGNGVDRMIFCVPTQKKVSIRYVCNEQG